MLCVRQKKKKDSLVIELTACVISVYVWSLVKIIEIIEKSWSLAINWNYSLLELWG